MERRIGRQAAQTPPFDSQTSGLRILTACTPMASIDAIMASSSSVPSAISTSLVLESTISSAVVRPRMR